MPVSLPVTPGGTGAGGAGDSLLKARAGSMASPQNGLNADRVSLSVPRRNIRGNGKTQKWDHQPNVGNPSSSSPTCEKWIMLISACFMLRTISQRNAPDRP